MSQATRVFEGVDAGAAAQIRTSLDANLPADADWRSVPHARFSVKAEGVVLTCYESGKLLLQGGDLETFIQRYLPDLELISRAAATAREIPLAVLSIGSDEAGKGDYFGPLTVAAACIGPEQVAELRAAGVTDSKRLSDKRAHLLAGHIETELDCEVTALMPARYNAAIAKAGNLNRLLADLHAAVLGRLLQRCPTVEAIVVDRFADESLLGDALGRVAPGHPTLTQTPKGERHLAVAAASIVARARFLDGLRECGTACGTELPKGAGAGVDAVAAELFRVGGRELLGQVAKLHFVTTSKVTGS